MALRLGLGIVVCVGVSGDSSWEVVGMVEKAGEIMGEGLQVWREKRVVYSRCGDPNHLTGGCPKPPKDKNQREFVEGSWSDNDEEDDEKVKDETCLVAQASNEIYLGVNLEPDEWIKDSRCSKHMTAKVDAVQRLKENAQMDQCCWFNITTAGQRLMLLDKVNTAAEVLKNLL
nr:alpha/beta hydrolases superfamily protein [Tanacetum cinerariifolium]